MSRQPARFARIEIVEADIDWYVEVDEQGREWTDKPSPSYRPHFLRLVASNGETLAHSENYANRQNARRALNAWFKAMAQVLSEYPDRGWTDPFVEVS